jgi:hypothetical protein
LPASAIITVENLPRTIGAIRRLDAEFAKELNRDIAAIGRPVRDRARSFVPSSPPLSNWQPRRRGQAEQPAYPWTKQARTGIVTGRSGKPGSIVVIKQKNAAGAVFDMAGKTGASTRTSQGEAFNRNLRRRYGPASRSMWKAAQLERFRTELAVGDVIAKAERRLTGELA